MPAALYSQLQHVALTGTRRLPLSKLTCDSSSQNPIEQTLHCALTQADTPPALRLLRAVAIAAVIERATWQAPCVAEAAEQFTLTPIPAQPPFADDIVQYMRELITEAASGSYQGRHFLVALLRSLHQAQQSLPPELLVHALALASHRPGYSTDKELRPYISPVLGARGYWLAQQNPAWQWAGWLPSNEELETIWQQGNLEQRQALLLEQRKTNPGAARERFAAGFEQMNSKERIALIETLAINLSMDDEPFLEGLLNRTDRAVSKSLRREIVVLLNKLPQSRHCQRIMAIVQGLLQQDKKGIWHIEAPEDFDPAWERDGISPDSYHSHNSKTGQRAACLCQLIEHTPLSFWTQTLDSPPAELFKWANTTSWRKELQLSWLQRIYKEIPNADPIWVSSYFDKMRPGFDRAHFLQKLAHSQCEAIWLAQSPVSIDSDEMERGLHYKCDFLSAELSQRIIKTIQLLAKRLKSRIASALAKLTNAEIKDNPEALDHLHNLVRYLDESVLPEVDTLLRTHQDQWSHYWPQLYQQTVEKLKNRHKLHACQTAITARAHVTLS